MLENMAEYPSCSASSVLTIHRAMSAISNDIPYLFNVRVILHLENVSYGRVVASA